MGDEDIGEVQSLSEIEEEIDNLRLDGNVQRGHRLVGDDQAGLQSQRACDADALSLAAGIFMRKALQMVRQQSHQADQLIDPGLDLGGAAPAVDTQRLGNQVADRSSWIEEA